MDYIKFKKSLQEIGEGEKAGGLWSQKEYTFTRLSYSHSDAVVFSNGTYYSGMEKIIYQITMLPTNLKNITILALLEDVEKTSWNNAPIKELLKAELTEMETPKTQKPPKSPTLIPAAVKVEFTHFSESFNFISDWQKIKTQLIERGYLNNSGKWIDGKNGHKTLAAGLIKWVAAKGYCKKTKFTWQEIQAFCIDDFGIDEISQRTIKGSISDHPDLYWLNSKT